MCGATYIHSVNSHGTSRYWARVINFVYESLLIHNAWQAHTYIHTQSKTICISVTDYSRMEIRYERLINRTIRQIYFPIFRWIPTRTFCQHWHKSIITPHRVLYVALWYTYWLLNHTPKNLPNEIEERFVFISKGKLMKPIISDFALCSISFSSRISASIERNKN